MSEDSKKRVKDGPMVSGLGRRQFKETADIGDVALGLNEDALGRESVGAPSKGALIGAVRLDSAKAYGDVPALLESCIKQDETSAWLKLKQRIDYLFDHLGYSVLPVLETENLKQRIKAEIEGGKKLFFKPNIVAASVLDLSGDGSPGLTSGVIAATNWTFMAALMRFFHDEMGIRYYQMAVGEAGVTTPAFSCLLGIPPEALQEGRFPKSDGATLWSGYPFYFVRKYLGEATKALDSLDDPMSGYEDGISGTYITPGEATRQGKLIMYELNNAECFDRGRTVRVPDGGDNYPDGIIIHKALVGDPEDSSNYPGNVLVNCPILKIHSNSVITSAIKNLGIGGWPMRAGSDSDPGTHDWLYAFPHSEPPGMKGGMPGGPNKGGVYHARWYVKRVNEEGMPLEITDSPNLGLDGTMVDINLAIKSQVPHMLHVVDAIRPINLEHGGNGTGVALDEGLIFTSEDPVAVDLLCARYLFKNVPRDPHSPSTFERPLSVPRYDKIQGAIVTDTTTMDDRISRSKLFSYSADRKLGQLDYYVEGVDMTAGDSCPLTTLDGHLGRMTLGKFEDVMTREFYYDIPKILWDLQPIVLAHAQATDDLTKAKLGYDPGYHAEFMALDENRDDVIDDTEAGRSGCWDCLCALGGTLLNMIARGKAAQGQFQQVSRSLKYSDKAWNIDTSTGRSVSVDTMRIYVDTAVAFAGALNMAKGDPGIDEFFGIPYGTGPDGIPKWPSLQYTRHCYEMGVIRMLHDQAKTYADEAGQGFTLFVPDSVPYFSSASYNPDKLFNIVEISDQNSNPKYNSGFAAKVFTAWFDNGEKW